MYNRFRHCTLTGLQFISCGAHLQSWAWNSWEGIAAGAVVWISYSGIFFTKILLLWAGCCWIFDWACQKLQTSNKGQIQVVLENQLTNVSSLANYKHSTHWDDTQKLHVYKLDWAHFGTNKLSVFVFQRNPEITLPKIFEWSKLDFGANKQVRTC